MIEMLRDYESVQTRDGLSLTGDTVSPVKNSVLSKDCVLLIIKIHQNHERDSGTSTMLLLHLLQKEC